MRAGTQAGLDERERVRPRVAAVGEVDVRGAGRLAVDEGPEEHPLAGGGRRLAVDGDRQVAAGGRGDAAAKVRDVGPVCDVRGLVGPARAAGRPGRRSP